MKTSIFSILCIAGAAHAFAPSQTSTSRRASVVVVRSTPVQESEASPSPPPSSEASTSTDAATSSSSDGGDTKPELKKNEPTWEVKQHLYGLDMINAEKAESTIASVTVEADGQVAGEGDGGEKPLPLPSTYITCGKCKSLFAIAEEDLGNMGKGCRVKCTVCSNSWYQSRERLFDIPTTSHDLLPANKADLDRIARNLSRDISPAFTGVGKLYVGNLDFHTTPQQLLEFFETNTKEKDVKVCDVSVVTGPDGRSRGFAFVSFYEESDGKAALECDGKECNGRELSVREPNN